MKAFLVTSIFFLSFIHMTAQENIVITNPTAEAILKGNFNPEDFKATAIISDHRAILEGINREVSPENLQSYIEALVSFETRNSGSDTLSDHRGIGAARTFIHQFFEDISLANESRLQTFYLQFDQEICGKGRHKNTCAILPGSDANNHEVIIIEAHMDSRCDTGCDIECLAQGAEDNASGTALVMELSRVMSPYTFKNTIVFMCTTAEEQGLLGANAFAEYCSISGIPVKAVFNNDVVGGIYCGKTSSPPPCPEEGHIDSTQVRMFAQSGISRQLARFNRLEYEEELLEMVDVPMMLSVMSQEDRTGRGGDHIPFRTRGYAAMRFTSANENGSANTGDPQYDDHQHTSDDILGIDTDGDAILDSFFVDFNYLARNSVINGMSATMAALGPKTPGFFGDENSNSLTITINDPEEYMHYRIFSRSTEEYFDTIYTLVGNNTIEIERINNPSTLQKVSVAAVDANGIESLFSSEKAYFPVLTSTEDQLLSDIGLGDLRIMQNQPNPFEERTTIEVFSNKQSQLDNAVLELINIDGKIVMEVPGQLYPGSNIIALNGFNLIPGIYYYRLRIANEVSGMLKLVKL